MVLSLIPKLIPKWRVTLAQGLVLECYGGFILHVHFYKENLAMSNFQFVQVYPPHDHRKVQCYDNAHFALT